MRTCVRGLRAAQEGSLRHQIAPQQVHRNGGGGEGLGGGGRTQASGRGGHRPMLSEPTGWQGWEERDTRNLLRLHYSLCASPHEAPSLVGRRHCGVTGRKSVQLVQAKREAGASYYRMSYELFSRTLRRVPDLKHVLPFALSAKDAQGTGFLGFRHIRARTHTEGRLAWSSGLSRLS